LSTANQLVKSETDIIDWVLQSYWQSLKRRS